MQDGNNMWTRGLDDVRRPIRRYLSLLAAFSMLASVLSVAGAGLGGQPEAAAAGACWAESQLEASTAMLNQSPRLRIFDIRKTVAQPPWRINSTPGDPYDRITAA